MTANLFLTAPRQVALPEDIARIVGSKIRTRQGQAKALRRIAAANGSRCATISMVAEWYGVTPEIMVEIVRGNG